MKLKLLSLLSLMVFVVIMVGCVEEVEPEDLTANDIKVVVIEPEQKIEEIPDEEKLMKEYEEFYAQEDFEDFEEGNDEDAGDYEDQNCISGWYVTGYYTPDEKDFSGNLIEVETDDGNRSFKEDFLETVQLEGWGKTLDNDFVGYYWDSWHINDAALDAEGNDLVEGIVAVETPLITPGSKLTIPTLPGKYGSQVFTASDTGVTGKHIDVYTGEGKVAEEEMYDITGEDNIVCILE